MAPRRDDMRPGRSRGSRSLRRRWTWSAVLLVLVMPTVAMGADEATRWWPDRLAGVGHVRPGVQTAQSVPIGGFSPYVAFGLTDERDESSFGFLASPSDAPGGDALPVDGAPFYDLALLDTGANLHLFRADTMARFDLEGAGLAGFNTLEIQGVVGTETGVISDALGLYAAGTQRLSGIDPLTLNPADMRGQTSVAVVTGEPGSELPNIVGMPLVFQHDVVIRPERPMLLRHDRRTIRSPQVDWHEQGTAPSFLFQAFMATEGDVGGVTYFPSDVLDPPNDPSLPSVSDQLFLTADFTTPGLSASNRSVLFDTGAQVSVISEQVAVQLGFDVVLDEPDFTVDILGAGGTLTDVPGIILESLNVQGTGGKFTLQDVPVIVRDIADPRGGVLDGLIGTNLLDDRSIVIDRTSNDLHISPARRTVWTDDADGTWSGGTWSAGVPNGAGAWVGLLGGNTTQRTVTLDEPVTAGYLQFDGEAGYRIDAADGAALTMRADTFDPLIRVDTDRGGGVHEIDAEVIVTDALNVDVRAGGGLTFGGPLHNAEGGRIAKFGNGRLTLDGAQHHAAGALLDVHEGAVALVGDAAAGGVNLTVTVDTGTLVVAQPQRLAGLTLGEAGTLSLTLDAANRVLSPTDGNAVAAAAQLGVADGFTAAGMLAVALAKGFQPRAGDWLALFDPMVPLAGSFAVSDLPNLPGALAWMETMLLSEGVLGIETTLAGDLDGDGFVTATDIDALLDDWRATGPGLAADLNGDGRVDDRDLGLLLADWTEGDAPLLAVPEPGGAAMLLVAGLWGLGRRRL